MPQQLLPNSDLNGINLSSQNISPSRTWQIGEDNIIGYTDGKNAIKQAIMLMLNIDRYEHLIYSFNYGHELSNLIGKDRDYIETEAPRLIKECLVQDDRISDVTEFNFGDSEDGLLIEFNVITIEGIIESEVIL